jgi:hypothetical protein
LTDEQTKQDIADTALVTRLNISSWGKTVEISGLYAPIDSGQRCEIRLDNCRYLTLEFYGDDVREELEANIIDFDIREDNGQEIAFLATTIFELPVNFGRLHFQKN